MTSLRWMVGRLVRTIRRDRPRRLPPPGPPEWFRWDAIGSRYDAYERLRRVIAANTITPDWGEAFGVLGIDDPTVSAHLGALDSPDRSEAVLALHGVLMSVADPAVLLEAIERLSVRARETARHDGAGPGSHLAWQLAYAMSAAAVAFERTDDARFAGAAVPMVESVLALRDEATGRTDDCRGGIGSGWGSGSVVPGRTTTNVTLTGRVVEPLAHLALLGRSRGGPLGPLADDAARIAGRAAAALDGEFVASPGGGGWYPVACGDRPEPLNHLAAFGAALVRLYDLEGDDRWRRRAADLVRWWQGSLIRDRRGGVVWRYDPSPRRRRGRTPELVWKAQVTVHFLHLAAERGIVIGPSDVETVRATLVRNVFVGDGPAATIGPDREPIEAFRGMRGGAASLLPMIELGGEVADRIERLVAEDPRAGGWLARPHGLVAYAHRLPPSAAD